MTSPEILQNTSIPKPKEVLELSREALAQKLGIAIEKIPSDKEVIKIFDKQLDELASTIGKVDPAEQAKVLKERLAAIQTAELADKAKELADKGKDILASEALEQTSKAVGAATEKLKDEGLAVGQDVLKAVGTIATAGSIADATKGVDSLSKAVDAGGKMVGKAIDAIKDIFSALFKMLGLDKLFKSIGGLFGMKFDEKEEKKENNLMKKKEKAEELLKQTPETVQTFAESLKDPEKRNEIIGKMSQSLGKKISDTYFGGVELSKSQLDKIHKILDSSFDAESLHKVAARLDKGQVNVGEIVSLSTDVFAAFPTKVLYELALSGIIPFWAITQRVIIDPSKTLISLTFEGLGIGDATMSLGDWNILLHDKFKQGDTLALDVARIQLYGINGILWKAMGSVFSTASAGLIALTDTASGIDGFRLAGLSAKNDFSGVASELEQIGKTLNGGKVSGDVKIFNQMLAGLVEVQTNAKVMQLAERYGDDAKGFLRALSENQELKHLHGRIPELQSVVSNPDSFRTKLKSLLVGPSENGTYLQDAVRGMKNWAGGSAGSMLHYLEKIDSIKQSQINFIGSKNIKALTEKVRLAYNSLKMARTADTVVIHLEDAQDVSKFRAFLSVIPGGIKGLFDVLPAASLVFSLGRVAQDAAKETNADTKDKLIDVMTYSLIPLYGSGCFLMSKTIDINNMIQNHEMPAFEDIALTGAIGGIALYETGRIAKGVMEIGTGTIRADGKLVAQGAKRLTYIHDITHSVGVISRGTRNVLALATKPAANPEFSKMLTRVAQKMPHKGRFAIGAAALLATSGAAYAYFSGPESPETIKKNLNKDGWIDSNGNMTDKLKEQFYLKNSEQRKEILDSMFMLFANKNKELPKTDYDEKTGKYTLVGDIEKFSSIIDSNFRRDIQSLGIDIDFLKA